MLVKPQADPENEDDNDVPIAPTPPLPTPATTPTSPTHEPSPPPQEPISSPLQEQPTQPTNTSKSSMTLLNTLMETCATLTQIKDESKQGWGMAKLDDDEDVTLVDVDTAVEMDADIQGRLETKDKLILLPRKLMLLSLQSLMMKRASCSQRKNKVQTLFILDKNVEEPSKKRVAKETLLQESFKKLRAEVEVSSSHSTQEETPTVDLKEMSEEDVQNMLTYWKIIRVGGITQAYQSFEDMLKDFDREDLDAL
nr:hypothetical protein [Tanacetum cinerariifolium]